MGKQWKQWLILFWGVPESLQMVIAAMKLKDACSLEEKLWQLDASPTRWTWVCVSCGSWWGTGEPGVLQSKGLQRVGHDWRLNWTDDQPRWHTKKQRHCFANKGTSSQGYGFPVVMYGCKSWTIKKAEHQRIDAVELWCWRRLLRVPWTARKSHHSILN